MNIALRFVDLCLFKAGPVDVPASHWLLKLTLLIYFIIGVAIGLLDSAWNISLLTSLADMLIMILVVWLLLQLRGFQARYLQTLTALAGAGCFLGIIGMPIIWWFNQANEHDQMSNFAMLLMIALMFWSLMVTAHIFRQALEIKPSTAAMITVIYTLTSLLAVGLTISGVA